MEQNQIQSQGRKFQPIDFGAIWQAIKKHRKLYYVALPVAVLLAFLIEKSITPYYNCQVILAPEAGAGGGGAGQLASLASSFGVSLGGGGNAGGDAITPSLYPDH